MREPLQTPPMLADLMADDGISWARLVTAIVLLGLSLAIGYQTARDPPRRKAVPQPVRERMVTGVELPPLEQTVVAAPLPFSSVPALASAARPNGTTRADSLRLGERRQIDRGANRSSERQVVRVRRNDWAVATSKSGTSGRSVRTRAQVRREYLSNRDVVAALTGEDSGSAYLMRQAARQHAAPPKGAGHPRG